MTLSGKEVLEKSPAIGNYADYLTRELAAASSKQRICRAC